MGDQSDDGDTPAALKQRIAALEHRLGTDDLTGLATKQWFFDYFAENARDADALMFIDLDDFKSVNDNYGHATGDLLLVQIASALQTAVGDKGKVARVSGDEFVGLFHGIDDQGLEAISAEVLTAISKCQVPVGELLVSRHASIGLAKVKHGMKPRNALIEADKALMEAKRTGKQKAVLLKERGLQLATGQPSVEEVHLGLNRREIGYFVQPIFDIRQAELWGYEALLRWRRPNGEIVGPAQFLETMTEAYNYGATPPLEAAHATAAWAALKQHKNIAFNISSAFLAKVADQKLDWVQTIVGDIPTDRIVFEIVETVVEQDTSDVSRVVSQLREKGIKVALDDFGIGQSTLSRLQTVPVDYVKIDKHFLASAIQSPRDKDILFRMIDLIRASEAKPVVEGIETEEQLALVLETSADYGQGFYLGRPNPTDHWDASPPEMPRR